MKHLSFLLVGAGALALVGCGGSKTERAAPAPTTEASATSSTEQSEADVRKIGRVGVQLYTLRGEMEKDFEGTLRKVAALGFDEVETAGLFGRDPNDVKALLAELGLEVPAAHINWKAFRDDPAAAITETKILGAEYIILAYLPEEERQTLAQWEEWIAFMNETAVMARAAGLTFAYHNHEFEFEPIDGVVPYDLILEKTDPDLVKMELDLYWTVLAGVDPSDYLAAHPGRFVLSHVKDLDIANQKMVDVGRGQIDFASIFAVAEPLGMKHFIVEHDNPDDPFASIKYSINTLEQLEY